MARFCLYGDLRPQLCVDGRADCRRALPAFLPDAARRWRGGRRMPACPCRGVDARGFLRPRPCWHRGVVARPRAPHVGGAVGDSGELCSWLRADYFRAGGVAPRRGVGIAVRKVHMDRDNTSCGGFQRCSFCLPRVALCGGMSPQPAGACLHKGAPSGVHCFHPCGYPYGHGDILFYVSRTAHGLDWHYYGDTRRSCCPLSPRRDGWQLAARAVADNGRV